MLEKPKFMEENYHYFDENEKLQIKEDAPKWAKKEYEEFIERLYPKADEDGIATLY